MWQDLGFKDNPYDVRPLRAIKEDADLLVGRSDQSIALCTALEASKEGVLILSGKPGVGKTSFLNVQQYLLCEGLTPFGPKVLPAFHLCPIQADDTPRIIALRALENYTKSIEDYCQLKNVKLPKEIEKIAKWVKANQTGGTGFEIGIQILGNGVNFGRQTTLPQIQNASFESLCDALAAISSHVTKEFETTSSIVVLDNIENLEVDKLKDLMLAFRDTLFMVPQVWWILIGQSGLATLIQTIDSRISDRLSGSGLELKSITNDEFNEAIQKRVSKFSAHPKAKSPLPDSIHKDLFEASNGEIRFVFKYSQIICSKFIENIRKAIISSLASKSKIDATAIANQISTTLINNQIPEQFAQEQLKSTVDEEIQLLALKPKEKGILKQLHKIKEARSNNYRAFGVNTPQEFSSKYLVPLFDRHLLFKRQDGQAVYYSLRGLPALAAKYNVI